MSERHLKSVPPIDVDARFRQLEAEIATLRARQREAERIRGIKVSPYITVMALGRLCERHNVEARVDWVDGMLQVRLLPTTAEVIPSA